MGFPSVSEFIIDVFRALPQELSERSSSLTESVSRGVVKLLHSINLPRAREERVGRASGRVA